MDEGKARARLARNNNAARMNEAAERWIHYDKSDPFTRDRVYSHMLNGIATPMRATRCQIEKYNRDDHGKTITPNHGEDDAYYDAEQYAEERSYNTGHGDTVYYKVPAFKNMVRP